MAIRFDQIELANTGHQLYPVLQGSNATRLRIQSSNGYVDIGSGASSSYGYLLTDRANFYIDKPVSFDGNIQGYGGDETASFAIYYDRNNTAYYLNPSGESILSTLTMYTAGATETTQINMPRAGFITFYGDKSQSHSISSRDSSGNTADDLRINTYGSLFINLDSNNNNTSGAHFMIGRHGGQQGTISDWAFKIDGETKNVGIGTTTNSDGDLSINAPKLHVKGADTTGAFNLIARFQGGNDSDNTGAAILINHNNDRGLLLSAGRKDSDREVAYFDLVSSGANVTRMFEIGKYGSDYISKFAKPIEVAGSATFAGSVSLTGVDVGGVTSPTLYLGQLINAYQAGMQSSVHLTMRTTNSSGNFYWYRGGTNLMYYSDALYVDKVVDKGATNYYLDPGSTGTSLNVAGGATFGGNVRIPVAWNSSTLENNAIYAKNSTDGFGFGNGTGISTWWAWSTENGLMRMIDVANSGAEIDLRTGNNDRVLIDSSGLTMQNNGDINVGNLRIVGDNDATDQGTAWIRSNGNYLVLNAVDGDHVYLNWDTGNGGGSGHVYVEDRIYAQVFYDRNDTNYYLDPNNTGTSLNAAGSVNAGSYQVSGTTRIDSNGKFFPASINGASKISFLNGSSAQGARVSSLYAGTTYANDNSAAGTVDVLNGYRVQGTTRINSVGDIIGTSYYVGGTNIVDTNRNLVNIVGITSTGNTVLGDSFTDKAVVYGHLGVGDDDYPKVAYPGQNALWSGQGSTTGQIVIDLPGTLSNYDMMYMEIDIYEYSSDASTKLIVGGHNWNSGGNSNTSTTMWHNVNVQVLGRLTKPVYFGRRNDGTNERRCIAIGETTSTWSYATVHVHKVHGAGFYSSAIDWVGDWNIAQTTSTSYFTKNPTTNFNDGGSQTFETNGIGEANHWFGSTSVRSPIFYDLDNTSYYVDPANTSTGLKTAGEAEVKSLRLLNGFTLVQGSGNYARLGSWIDVSNIGLYSSHASGNGAHLYPNASSDYGAWRIDGSKGGYNGITFAGTSSTFNTLMSQANGGSMGLFNDTDNEWYLEAIRNAGCDMYYNGVKQLETEDGYALATNQMRAPIFYDSDDTNYYLNPASSSTSFVTKGDWRVPSGIAWSGEYTGGGKIQQHSNHWYLQSPDAGGVIFRNASASNKFIFDFTPGDGTATGSWKAPIFYDSADTNYYVDPASTSIVKYLGRRAHGQGLMVGGYNNIGASHAKTNPIFTIGSSYLPSDTALSNMYGIGYTRGDMSGMPGTNGWGMYVAADGDARIFLDGQNGGVGTAQGSWRAPIFYDSDNTGYYVNPGASASLNLAGTIISSSKGHVLGTNSATAQTAVLELKQVSGAEQLRLTDGDSLGTSWGPFMSFYDGDGTRRGYVQGAGTSSTAMDMRVVSQYGSFSVYTDASGGVTERLLLGSDGNAVFRGQLTGESYVRSLATYQITLDAVHGGGPIIEFGATNDHDQYGSIGHQGGEYQFGTHSRDFAWYQGTTKIMELDHGGGNQEPVLAIGWNVAADNTKGTLQVFGHNNTDGTVRLGPHSSKGSTFSHIHYGSNGDWYIRPASNSGSVFVLNYSAISDERLKENIVDSEYGLSEITSLRPRNFNWIDSSTDDVHTGFVAQEVEAVVSKWITQGELDDHKSVDYNAITATLVKAVQELKAENEDLLNRVKALENK